VGDDANQDLLAGVLGVVGLTQEPQGQAVHRMLEVADQGREGLAVALGGWPGQLVQRWVVVAHREEVWMISPRSGSSTSTSRSCILGDGVELGAARLSRRSPSGWLQVNTSS
jgi:hypothetical protein